MDLLACNLPTLAFFPTVRQTLLSSVAISNYIAKATCVRNVFRRLPLIDAIRGGWGDSTWLWSAKIQRRSRSIGHEGVLVVKSV